MYLSENKKEKEGIYLSFKKKMIKGMLGLSILYATLQLGNFFEVTEANALGGSNSKTKPYYGDRLKYMNDPPPVSISFTSKSSLYNYYGHGDNPPNTMSEEYYKNRFLWYSIVPREDPSNWESYMARMKENNQQELGTKYWEIDYYADSSMIEDYRFNLKTGQDSPFDTDGKRDGYNTGSKVVTYGKYKGYYYEWRYLGYNADGEPIGNPYFPDDYPASNDSDNYWRGKNWQYQSWFDGYANFYQTDWDRPGNKDKKIAWFNKYLKPAHPDLFKGGKDASYWVDYLSMRNNPELSTGIVEGWHKSGGRYYYKSFVMKSPERPNLRLTNFTIKEKDTKRVIGTATRSTTSPFSFDISYGSKDQYIHQSKTYIIEGTIKNMYSEGMNAHDTNYTPVHAELAIAYDDTVHKTNEYDEIYKGSNGCQPTSPTNSIKYNTSQKFSCEFTIPNNFSNEIEIGLRIANGFDLLGDNTNNEDDESYLVFERSPNDMAIKNTIEFIDQDGVVTEEVMPDHAYDVRFYVTRPEGDTPVGAVGNAQNPFTTLDIRATDKGTVSVSRKVVATQVLNKGKTIVVTANDLITPKTNVIEACAKINSIHVTKGQNIMNGNDGEVCKKIQSDINISVKDFAVKPKSVYLPTGLNTSYETLNFDFVVTNFNEQGYSKDIPYVIKKGSTVIKQGILQDVPANLPTFTTVALSNIPLTQGTHGFRIEVNPVPRAWFESVAGVTNPYLDNVATNSITVHKTPAVVKCNVENTYNSWTTTYSVYEWWGYQESHYHYGYTYGNQYYPGYWHTYCVTTGTNSYTQTINHYEEYKIDKVYFRSKITDDNNGGWINIKGGTEGKVKAGYGFEIKVVAKYTTNINTAPKPWSSGCSGKAVSPSTGSVKATERITLTMPFNDLYGNKVKYTLDASVSGSWYNETQTYQMDERPVFGGLKNTREIFVNEGAKDGTYQIKIETDGNFHGSYDKPYTKNLCDIENVNITIVGSDRDDLKTHITQ